MKKGFRTFKTYKIIHPRNKSIILIYFWSKAPFTHYIASRCAHPKFDINIKF